MSEPTIYRINPMTITSGESGHKVVICKGRYLGVLEPVEPDYIDQPRVRQAILEALLPQMEAGGGIECALLADAAIAAILGIGGDDE